MNGQPQNTTSRPARRSSVRRCPLASSWVIAVGLVWAVHSSHVTAQQPGDPFAGQRQTTSQATGDSANGAFTADTATQFLTSGPDVWTSPEGMTSALQVMLLLTVLSLAPAVLLMTTSFVRIVVVLGLLRQALGAQQLPPSQVITSLALFMTMLIMGPVWKEVYDEAIGPYTDTATAMSLEETWAAGVRPLKVFMGKQIRYANNTDDVWLFYRYYRDQSNPPTDYLDVPIEVLAPAFMLSELKIAFMIGFQVYLPFVILDIVVSSVTISMGMLMLPPAMVSLPFKLLLFVLVDGWRLVVQALLESFVPYT